MHKIVKNSSLYKKKIVYAFNYLENVENWKIGISSTN